MPRLNVKDLPVKQAEDYRQQRKGKQIADGHARSDGDAHIPEHTVEQPDKAPAGGAEDDIEVTNALFHGGNSLCFS